MDSKFSSLPDYPALKKLAAALWEQDGTFHGAAVMVGAGFSRAGASTGEAHRTLPLWHDFSRILAADLASSSLDPLRLAEEYDAYFGKQTLHELIKKEVNDAAWNPGELHRLLLNLPWTDVLTTNWDTLLERASKDVHEPVYSVVFRQDDLSNARAPRIIKLHGTIDVTHELIFTQEDYRKYPQQHAAFVNVARQVFIENELCLLGFSGEDPNFLQWAGWVRDNLADRSRRIYLVGALALNAAKRRYLESINVAPIDLHDLVAHFDDADMRHREATALFLQYLHQVKPAPAWDWRPKNARRAPSPEHDTQQAYHDSAAAARILNDQLLALADDRLAYPGWLIPPATVRRDLDNQIPAPGVSPGALSQMSSDNRAKLLYEIIWLHDKTYEVLPHWLLQALLSVCDPDKPCVLSKKQQLEVAAALLKNTRMVNDVESLAAMSTAILEKGAKYWPDGLTELAYHRAIVARDTFDYAVLKENVDKMDGSDPVWALRKAALLAELCEFEASESLVAGAYRELLVQHRHDQHSLSLFSRLAWAHWIKRGIDRTSFKVDRSSPARYQQKKCYPADHLEQLQRCIDEALVRQHEKQQVQPLFEPGRYRDNAQRIILRHELHPFTCFDRMAIMAGLPLRWKNMGFLVKQAETLTQMDDIDDVHRIQLAIRAAKSHDSAVLNRVFSRITIACMRQDVIDDLLAQCEKAIAYWRQALKTPLSQTHSHVMERQKIAENIWGAEPDYKALPPTGLLRSVLLEIPSPDPAAVNVLIREYLFGARGEDAFSEDRLLSIVNAAMMEKHPERPTAEEALDAFNHMVMWRPADDEDFLGYRRQEEERRSGSLGKALAHSIVPALSPSMLTEENFSKLLDAFDAWKTPALLVTLTCFAYGNACFADRVERIIRQKLHAKDANCVAQASYALLAWREKAASAATSRLLTRMVFVISAHHLTGLQALLWTAHALLEKGFLAEEHIDLLAENLPIIFDSAAYENIPSASRESVSISFVRTGCVRLASAILKRRRGLHPELERIINDAARDPLPEVRFAERNRG
ncbi:SIR2 family NAD-dependent protein deacylase [Hafnia alvei]|uniref:SIR2 family NAD-dependent protein deacylase n=1 Tax=Hafnia alvei TaxID=569 RepID=UPI00103338E3|nr:SIR2 family protein [Hafnia alvei]TBM15418.1 SIR2 family protein [Hafnia alvei]